MTDSERISVLEQRIEKLENIIKLLSANNDDEILKLSLTSAPVLYSCDFTDGFVLKESDWRLDNGIVISQSGMLSFCINDNVNVEHFADPRLYTDEVNVDSSLVKYLHVRFKGCLDNGKLKGWYDNNVYYNAYAQFYFKTDKDTEWTQSKSISFYYCSDETVDAYIEIKHSLWRDKIVGIRFDPAEKITGNVEMYLIELLGEVPSSGIGGWMKNVNNRLDILDEKVEMSENKLNNIVEKGELI